MSLINEALKKAQRQRLDETGDVSTAAPAAAVAVVESVPAPATGEQPARRGKTSGANTLLLFGAGGVVLVVLSVVVTVVLLNRSPASAPATFATTRPAPDAPPVNSVATRIESPPLTPPVIVPPANLPAAAAATPTPPVEPVVSAPAKTIPPPPANAAAPIVPPAPVAAEPAVPAVSAPTLPAPATAAAPQVAASAPAAAPVAAPKPAPAKPDERIATFVEAIKVTGIRSMGAESRVLMNDRVYRVNDTVERTLGVKLTKVGADSLTFVDAKGFEYVKSY